MTWFRGRSRWWLLVAAGVLVVAGAVINELKKPIWGVAVAALLGFLGTQVVPLMRQKIDARDAQDRVVREFTAGPVAGGRRLPKVRDADLGDLGVRRALVDVSYQHRDAEAEVWAALRRGEPVLVVGRSMDGKSRMCAEIVKADYPDHDLFRPLPGKLQALLSEGVPHNAVVWLDDLERYLNESGLREDWLELLSRERNIVIASIRATERAALAATGEFRHTQDRALRRFSIVRMSQDDTEKARLETARLVKAMPEAATSAGVARYGLGGYLGGGYLAVERFEDAADNHPLGRAMVKAAVDWRRTGLEGISEADVAELAPVYLSSRRKFDPGESAQQALQWATERIMGVVQLLEITGDHQVRASDYILDHLSPTDAPEVPHAIWSKVVASPLTPQAMFTLGLRALSNSSTRRVEDRLAGEWWMVSALWRRAAESGDLDVSPRAATYLGELLEKQGDLKGAQEAYELAVESGSRDFAPRAANALGQLLGKQGDLTGARTAYQLAIDSGHDAAMLAVPALGQLLLEYGDLKGAEDVFQRALDSGHPGQAVAGALGLLALDAQGNFSGSEVELQRAVGAASAGAKAASDRIRYGEPAWDSDDQDVARAASHAASPSGHLYQTPKEAADLGLLLAEHGDVKGAKAAFQWAADSGDPEQAPRATINLGVLSYQAGDLEGARAAFQLAIDSGHPDHAPRAAFYLGVELMQHGELVAAQAPFQRAIDSKHPEFAPKAALGLGDTLKKRGLLNEARAAYQQAIDSGRGDVGFAASMSLHGLDGRLSSEAAGPERQT